MMNKNNTRRALFLSAVSMFLCIVMLAGSTYAWFTDTVEVKTSRIEAGVLDVELEYTNDAVGGTWVNVEDIDPTLTYAPFFLDADGMQTSRLSMQATVHFSTISLQLQPLSIR